MPASAAAAATAREAPTETVLISMRTRSVPSGTRRPLSPVVTATSAASSATIVTQTSAVSHTAAGEGAARAPPPPRAGAAPRPAAPRDGAWSGRRRRGGGVPRGDRPLRDRRDGDHHETGRPAVRHDGERGRVAVARSGAAARLHQQPAPRPRGDRREPPLRRQRARRGATGARAPLRA